MKLRPQHVTFVAHDVQLGGDVVVLELDVLVDVEGGLCSSVPSSLTFELVRAPHQLCSTDFYLMPQQMSLQWHFDK